MAIAKKFFSPENIERVKKLILRKINITEKGCWEWTGVKETPTKGGEPRSRRYGRMRFANAYRYAHRVSKAFFHGPLHLLDDRKLLCCHKCDNPLCVNPEHIFLGTHADNNKDKVAKGRHVYRLSCPECKHEF